jgi:phospholipase/carboxylesterase
VNASASFLLAGEPQASATAFCVFAHGRGQSPEAMDEHILRRIASPQVAFVLPRATNGAWYDARAIEPLSEKTESQLSSSLAQLHAIVANLPNDRPIVVAGFSQGACLSIEYALRFGGWNGALVAFTGCRVGATSDKRPLAGLSGLPAYVSGAPADPWIPLNAFSHAVHDLGAAGARLRADVFPQRGHEVSDTEVKVLERGLHVLAAGKGNPW